MQTLNQIALSHVSAGNGLKNFETHSESHWAENIAIISSAGLTGTVVGAAIGAGAAYAYIGRYGGGIFLELLSELLVNAWAVKGGGIGMVSGLGIGSMYAAVTTLSRD